MTGGPGKEHGTVTRVYVPRFLVSSQQRNEMPEHGTGRVGAGCIEMPGLEVGAFS